MPYLLPVAVALVALLYASVGHAGATGYIAVMTLLGLPPAVVRPTALVLNVIVATIATAQFGRAGHFRRQLFWPLAVASVPCAALGGGIDLPTAAFEAVVGLVLLVSAARIVGERRRPAATEEQAAAAPSTPVLIVLGGVIGLLSGLTGVGGGVFLTPALLALQAAPVKQIAALTAPFILVNSLAGLGGGITAGRGLPEVSPAVIAAAVIGGAVGSQLGAFRLPVPTLRSLMAVVLACASLKLLSAAAGLP